MPQPAEPPPGLPSTCRKSDCISVEKVMGWRGGRTCVKIRTVNPEVWHQWVQRNGIHRGTGGSARVNLGLRMAWIEGRELASTFTKTIKGNYLKVQKW